MPDNIEGVKVGDVVYFHVTNLEQDWDVPHGFAVKGALNSELLVLPGETSTIKWVPDHAGVYPMFCTDFCSALHQEMQGYVRVSPAGTNTAIKFSKATRFIIDKEEVCLGFLLFPSPLIVCKFIKRTTLKLLYVET